MSGMEYGQRTAAVRKALAEPRTVADLAGELGMVPSRVKGLVSYLVSLGQVSRVGDAKMPSGQIAAVFQVVGKP